MTEPISGLAQLLSELEPQPHPGVFVFAAVDEGSDLESLAPIATFREEEGLCVIVAEQAARERGLEVGYRAAWITLSVHSALEAVGLTASVAAALTTAGIPCNVVAALHHDHLFVPSERVEEAMTVLRSLQEA